MVGYYGERYAGGASIALELIIQEFASHVHINDIDPSVWAFWHSVLNDSENLCRLISKVTVDMHTWTEQRESQKQKDTVEIGRASCRERVCQYVVITVVGV